MLESAVARLLNNILGKYVVDLDTENLNVGIFSGQAQLTDLKLKTEALFELGLPIEVKAGTIGKIHLQIPWTALWSQPIVVNVEDLHILCAPILSKSQQFDAEKNKNLVRAFKRKILNDLNDQVNVIGGPKTFSEHLFTNVLSTMQLTISSVHVRYEDAISGKTPISAGLCIGSICAESVTRSRASGKCKTKADSSHYLVKIETLSAYWNTNSKQTTWDLPAEYYTWRNAMSSSLQNFFINNEQFEFVLKPMTSKIKIAIGKSSTAGNIVKCATEIILQDCNVQLSKQQFDSIRAVSDSLHRMLISWSFLDERPRVNIQENAGAWWRYAYRAVLEQKIRPYTWKQVKKVRDDYRQYVETYKQIILNPNDTELKLDIQKYEDQLSIVNIVIARQQARLLVQSRSLNEKNFWAMLPSPERNLLCKKIGFTSENCDDLVIEQKYSLCFGNINISLTNSKEFFLLTLTQTSIAFSPDYLQNTFLFHFKVEGLILEGSSDDEQLTTVMASEHLSNSPAYFCNVEWQKLPANSKSVYKLSVALDAVECLYNTLFFEDVMSFFCDDNYLPIDLWGSCNPSYFDDALLEKWDINLNIKIPFIVIPQSGSFAQSDNLLIIDFGRYTVTTEFSQTLPDFEEATKMELEEHLYTKLHIECTDMQVLFCQNSNCNWKDERNEKNTNLHVMSKTSFHALYARCFKPVESIPKNKFSINFQAIKLNLSERNIEQLLKYFEIKQTFPRSTKQQQQSIPPEFQKDNISVHYTLNYLKKIESNITLKHNFTKRKQPDREKVLVAPEKVFEHLHKEDMNEAYAKNVDLPGLEDNISPNNNIITLLRFVVNEFTVVFSKSIADNSDRQYIIVRLGFLNADLALMTHGPAYQLSINSILLTDKLHTTTSGQYLDLVYTPIPSTIDVVVILYRKVSASCPDFWTHFHGVETSLVADFGNVYFLLHQEAIHTVIKYSKYLVNKLRAQVPSSLCDMVQSSMSWLNSLVHKESTTPVPPGSVKFSHSARCADVNIRVCNADYDIINVQVSGLEMDFLFRANERFVFRSYLSSINIEHLSEVTLYSKILSIDDDKAFEVKYVRHAAHVQQASIAPSNDEIVTGGSLKFQLGQIHFTVLYKLIVQIHRFVVNLEAIPYINTAIEKIQKAVSSVTETLKASKKINLAINICGPTLLFPQKSSSPNVIVLDTGELTVENFFKDYNSDFMENILIKWAKITITRGVMTLTPSLEQQETLIEPISLNVDVKHYTNIKTAQRYWDVDGALDSIQITLGQRDISTILAVYSENIGEGKLLDLFPNPIRSPIAPNKADETVKNLEAFFCEPKQKNVVCKFLLDEITLLLFFDSGELLSSPIRDLSHGLCNLKVIEINTTLIVYTDGSLDGKLSADSLKVEEIGPNISDDHGILQSPTEDNNKTNNCNITINQAPILDITFHQNKSEDRSADIIIGKLSLTLSVPLCEKIALFAIECLPKENFEYGIVNHGYEFEQQHQEQLEATYSKSLTISLRINKPEFIFMVETTSNLKRYFITHMEILSDYSQHGNRLNWVVSLSGLHCLLHNISSNSSKPYMILKQCDVEFSKCFSDEKGNKIIASISSIYVQICSNVMHSLTDVLNDIAEHFKVPEIELPKSDSQPKAKQDEDLWKPAKIEEMLLLLDSNPPLSWPKHHNVMKFNQHEILLVPKFDIVVIFELEDTQVLLVKSTLEMTMYDWTSLLNATCECTIQANYFNEKVQSWEPILDPVVVDEQEFKPWDVLVKVFQDKPLSILGSANEGKKNLNNGQEKKTPHTTEDEDSGEDMMYLEPINPLHNRHNRRVKTSLSTFLDDSDSENEDGAMEKLACAISDLFTGDWNESEDSDYIHSSEGEEDSEEYGKAQSEEKPNFQHCSKATYVLIDAKEVLNFTITPHLLKLANELVTSYSNKTLSVSSKANVINVVNDIGPKSKIELYQKGQAPEAESRLLEVKTYENQDSPPNSPSKLDDSYGFDLEDTADEKDGNCEDQTKCDSDSNYDFATISSLNFPKESTSELYDKINSHYLKIFVPNCQPIQTNCSKRKWQKMMRLHSNVPGQQPYYLAASHDIDKSGRNVVISSPLQIKNETNFALSLHYQPSVLQQLNLEPVGDVTNPFETTMRIAVLEPHENYNVPLYIAYHCKLFIQPAYAEGNYQCNSGIWWQDLATELEVAHNIQCKPKTNSNLEIFSLRIMLTKNFKVSCAHAHSIPNYVINILPPLIFHNLLPYVIEIENVTLNQQIKIEPGEKKSIYALDLTKDQKLQVRLKHNLTTWTGILNFTTHLDEKILILYADGKDVKNLAINTKSEREGSCNLFFYTPYWIVNKTGLPLQMKASVSNAIYESSNKDILLFTYKRHGKQTLNLRVYESNWSNEFGLECAGTTGLIVCKDNERKKKYLFFLSIELSQMCPRLIKIVTILPSFLITNKTGKSLRFMEHNEKTDLWIDLAPGQTITFWPETSSMQMYVKYRDSKLISHAFNIAIVNRTVLRMDKGGALTVDVSGGVTDSFKINFLDYSRGDAPILIKNYCPDLFLKIQQQEQSQVTLLSPYNSLLYTWDDPTRSLQLLWNVYNNKGTGFLIDIFKDAHGEEKIRLHTVNPTSSAVPTSSSDDSDSSDSVKTTMTKKVRKDKIVIYWACYREASQRILLFSQETHVYHNVLRSYFWEPCKVECLVSLAGLGLSIFSKEDAKKEHLYGALIDSPATWEVNVGLKWKTLTLELASWIEDKYRLNYKKCQLRDYVHIDFEKMYMLKPFFAELRRTYTPALYCQCRISQNYKYYNVKLNNCQVDDKITNTIVMYPLSGKNCKGSNTFVDISLLKNTTNYGDVYRYIDINIRDFYLNIENYLFAELKSLVQFYLKFNEERSILYINDMKSIQDLVVTSHDTDEKWQTVIEHLRLNNFEIQLHISNKTSASLGGNSNSLPFCNINDYLFPINISPYMPMEGVVHKISSVEHVYLTQTLLNVITNLYQQIRLQFLQQYYSHVLGLQVLVNTFAIQPSLMYLENDLEKMANTLLFGARCLLGHINMSPAALEQCIIDIFANQTIENIQRIRRHASTQKCELVPKEIMLSAKNFQCGVPNALNQLIVKKQNAGLHCDGEMFFRTTGKALYSLITRHPDDKSDSVEVAKEAIRRATLLGEPIRIHYRLNRYKNKYLGIKPYSVYQSIGQHLLETVGNCRFINDTYWSHGAIDKIGKSILLISLQHVIKLNKSRLWATWDIEWFIELDDIISLPKIVSNELIFNMRQSENSMDLLKINGDKEVLIWLHEKIEQAIILSIEDKSWLAAT